MHPDRIHHQFHHLKVAHGGFPAGFSHRHGETAHFHPVVQNHQLAAATIQHQLPLGWFALVSLSLGSLFSRR